MSIRDDSGGHAHDGTFDRAMRELHAQALVQVSPQTRARLRAARTTAVIRRAPVRGLGWALASGCAAVFALAIGLQWHGPSPTATVPTNTVGTDAADYSTDSSVATLDENPDLYLWLASSEATLPVALER